MAKKETHSGLDPARLGIAGGIIWGVSLFGCTLISIYTGWWMQLLGAIANIYPWYSITVAGSVAGLINGFVDAFIFFYLLAWFYNRTGKN